jgi:hypothetical protein
MGGDAGGRKDGKAKMADEMFQVVMKDIKESKIELTLSPRVSQCASAQNTYMRRSQCLRK